MLTACDLGPYLSHHYVIFHFILEAYQLSSSINLIFLLKKKNQIAILDEVEKPQLNR